MSPTHRSLALLVAWLALALAAAWAPWLAPLWLSTGAGLLGWMALDALRLRSSGPVEVERQVAPSVAIGTWSRVSLEVTNRGQRGLALVVHDHVPPVMTTRDLPREIELGAAESARIEYGIYPTERGDHDFGKAELVLSSPAGLWRGRRRAGAGERVRVYPNFRAVMRYAFLARSQRTSQLGIRRRPRRGEGLDFHQLREYREGDTLRQIDWRVTSRLRKLISREYQDERDQRIVFLLDCGRKMHSKDDELSHFDHALDAVLLLSHVALRQGDAVGLLTFAGERRWLAPRKGVGHLTAIMNSVYDLRTSLRTSDYLAAARDLATRMSKRALVVLVSNLRDEEHEELSLALNLLSRRHLVLLASMQERVLGEALSEPVHHLDAALRVAATRHYLQQRRRAHQTLQRAGALALDVEPGQLPVALVNGYLDVKSRGVL
ncbi:MAG: DUF58 domain-containing protein [Myxococcota bacterium]